MGVLDDVINIIINNKEVQSITISDGGILYKQNVDNYLLTITTDKNSISYSNNEYAFLTATLTCNDVPIEGELVVFDVGDSQTILLSGGDSYNVSTNYYMLTLNNISFKITIYGNPSSQYTLQIQYSDSDNNWHILHPPTNTDIILGSNKIYVNDSILYYVDVNGNLNNYDVNNYNVTNLRLWQVNGIVLTTNLFAEVTNNNGIVNIEYYPSSIGNKEIIVNSVENTSNSINIQVT